MTNIYNLHTQIQTLVWQKKALPNQPACFGKRSSFLACLNNAFDQPIKLCNLQSVIHTVEENDLINRLLAKPYRQYWLRFTQLMHQNTSIGQTMVWVPTTETQLLKIVKNLGKASLGSWLFQQSDYHINNRFYAKQQQAYLQLASWQVNQSFICILEKLYPHAKMD